MEALLDSSFIVDTLRGRRSAAALAHALVAEDALVGIPTPVLYEIQTGLLHRGGRAQAARFGEVFSDFPLVAFDDAAARRSAEIQAEALQTGRAHGDVDAMIAGIALEHGCVLVTADAAFDAISASFGLRLRRY